MSKEQPKKVVTPWVKPDTRAEIEKSLLKNLQGFAVKGARIQNKGFYSTGHFNLDFAIARGTLPVNVDFDSLKDFDLSEPGGIPKGRLIEVYGEPGGGKSSLCRRAVGNAQKHGKICVWVDREMSFVESLAEINGVNLDELFMMNDPSVSAEQCFDHIFAALDSGVDLIVVDSVAGLVPKAILEGTDSSKDTVALLARIMGKCIPKLATLCAKTGGTVIFINQIRQRPGVLFGDPTTTPGGDTLKFYSSLRLQITKRYGEGSETYRQDDNGVEQLIAQDSYVYVRKNRFSKKMKEGIPVPIYFEPFFPNAEEVAFDLGRRMHLIKVREGIFSWKTGPKSKLSAQGRNAFISDLLKQDLLPKLIEELKQVAKENKIILPPEVTKFEILNSSKTKKRDVKRSKESELIETYLENDAQTPQEEDEETSKEADAILDG